MTQPSIHPLSFPDPRLDYRPALDDPPPPLAPAALACVLAQLVWWVPAGFLTLLCRAGAAVNRPLDTAFYAFCSLPALAALPTALAALFDPRLARRHRRMALLAAVGALCWLAVFLPDWWHYVLHAPPGAHWDSP